MARIELTQSGVIFNEELHEYWLDGKQLSGITEALRKQLHPDMYSSIPKRILEHRARARYRDRGHLLRAKAPERESWQTPRARRREVRAR